MISTFEAETNETFFDATSTIGFRLYLTQNQSAAPQNLNSIVIQLSSGNLQLPNAVGYSVNVSNANLTFASQFNRTHAGAVQFSVSGSLPNNTNNSYMEIKFNATVPATSDPLALLQVAFTMNAIASGSGSVTYGPRYSPELYTSYPVMQLARTTEEGKLKINVLFLEFFIMI